MQGGRSERPDLWGDVRSAEHYDRNVKKDGRARALALLQRMNLRKEDRVLDVGAGPGTHSIPLAGMVDHVTAVEPSNGMAVVLEKNLADEKIGNVTCIRKVWEDVTADELGSSYDVVLASLSLDMPDIRSALMKMDRCCTGRVYVIWPAGMTAWETHYLEAWPLIHGTEYRPGPKADILFNILYQAGICPDVEVYREDYRETFSSIAEATEYNRSLYMASDPEKEAALMKYLGRKLDRDSEGLQLRGVSIIAMLSWDVMINRLGR
jgi:Methylase involved in ubiquinone/menaquinone biosynthesis